jgi:hypothetical protein
MVNCANNFEPSSLVVQQTKIYYDVRTDTGVTTTYEIVKDVHVVHGKRKRTGKNTGEDDMWKKQLIFWELPY